MSKKLVLKKSVSKSTGSAKELSKKNKVSTILKDTQFSETLASSGTTATVRCGIKLGFVHPKNYNSMQVDVAAEIPFNVEPGATVDETFEALDNAFAALWEKVEELSDEKAGEALDTLSMEAAK